MRQPTAESLYRLKREFRSLVDIKHPHLVEFHDLLCIDDVWMITMELVEGSTFLDWVRPPAAVAQTDVAAEPLNTRLQTPPDLPTTLASVSEPAAEAPTVLDQTRLRAVFRQLCEGVAAIHRAGKLHRDLKPSNVLVTHDGRVVILDFGLIEDFTAIGGTLTHGFAGTPVFMAPEQMSGQSASPASDWYAVGVMLLQALTSRVPFHGSLLEVFNQKMRFGDRAAEDLRDAEPGELATLCRALLDPRPEMRPSAAEVLTIARRGELVTPPAPPASRTTMIGRDAELMALRQALDLVRQRKTVVVRLRGESGIGKSTLATAFARWAINTHGALVLQGRCYERETVPYKALDSVVDALSHYLKHLSPSDAQALLPRDPHSAARLFPVLGRVDVIARAAIREHGHDDPIQLRRAGFAALREMLSRVADRKTVVLHIDDSQWGDADSAEALVEMLRPPGQPELMLLITHRPEAEARPFMAELNQHLAALPGLEIIDLVLSPLSEQAARDLAARLIPSGAPLDSATVARESGGNPFLIAELTRDLQLGSGEGEMSFTSLIVARASRLSPAARRVLDVIAIAGQPIARETASRAAGLARLDSAILHELDALHLARTTETQGGIALECYHDRIREALLAPLTPDAIVALHRELAQAFEATGGPAEALALHHQAAGDRARAASYALDAAEHASKALAFERAVRLYQMALSLIDEDDLPLKRRIYTRLGDAFVNAGLGYEAARAYLAADPLATGPEQLELQRRAVHELLSTGHFEEGLTLVKRLFGAIGFRMPETRVGIIFTLARLRLALRLRGLGFTRANEGDIPQSYLVRMDTCYSIATGLAFVDPLRGAVFQTRHTLLALRSGEPFRVTRALAYETGYRSMRGIKAREAVARLVDRSRRLAAEVNNPYTTALCVVTEGVAACECGEWRRALALCDEGLEALNACSGVRWERATFGLFGLFALVCTGQWRVYQQRCDALVDEARQRGDLYTQTCVALLSHLPTLADDDPTAAHEQTRASMSRWSSPRRDLQWFWHTYALCEIDMYAGHGAAAFRRVQDFWPDLRSSLMLSIQAVNLFGLYLKGRCAVAAASEGERGALAVAADAASRIEKQRAGWAMPFADIIRAGIAGVEGRAETVAALLESARVGLVVADMPPWLAAVSYWRDSGRDSASPQTSWFVANRVRNPERLSALLVPGVRRKS